MSLYKSNIMSNFMLYHLIDNDINILTINVLNNSLPIDTEAINQYIINTNSKNIKIKSTNIFKYACEEKYSGDAYYNSSVNTKICNLINNLPKNIIQYLFIDESCFNGSLDMLPDSLIRLRINSENFKYQIKIFPKELKEIELEKYNYNINNFPDTLEILKLHSYSLKITKFPKKLKSLELERYKYELNKLPKSLEILKLNHYKYNELNNLPSKLRVLHICSNNNIPLDNLPPNLKELYICCEYNNALDNLPQGLEVLNLPYDYNFKLVNLPNTLKILYISSYDLNLDCLPDSIEELYFKFQISDEIDINKIPMNLKLFCLNASYTFNDVITKQIKDNNIKFITRWIVPDHLNYHEQIKKYDDNPNPDELINEIF